MKTAIQEAIDLVIKELDEKGYEHPVMISQLVDLLVLEKQQIIDAWEDGSIPDASDDATLSGEQYYNETFKQQP